jgi:hypothetical protein
VGHRLITALIFLNVMGLNEAAIAALSLLQTLGVH